LLGGVFYRRKEAVPVTGLSGRRRKKAVCDADEHEREKNLFDYFSATVERRGRLQAGAKRIENDRRGSPRERKKKRAIITALALLTKKGREVVSKPERQCPLKDGRSPTPCRRRRKEL